MRILSVLLLSSLLVLSSCHFIGGERVTGNGKITSRQKSVGSFKSVEASGQVIVHVRQDASNGVKIETDENLFDYIETYVDGGTLVIRTKRGYNLDPSKEIIAYVSAPEFRNLEVSGQSDIIGDSPLAGKDDLSMHISGQGEITLDVNYPAVSAHLSGQGTINLKGQANDFRADISGQGDVKCFELMTDHTSLDISGSSDVEIMVNKTLDVDASGSSTIKYKGNGQIGKQSTSGSSSIEKV
jgi:hypothetical protein